MEKKGGHSIKKLHSVRLPVVVEPRYEIQGIPVSIRAIPVPIGPDDVRFISVGNFVKFWGAFTLAVENCVVKH